MSCRSEFAPASAAEKSWGERVPIMVVFFALGMISASWAARMPAIRSPLHLSDEALGLALLGPAAGAVLAMPAAGAALARVSPRRVVLAAFVPLATVLPLVTAVESALQLFAVLFAWGACAGVIDVGMNTEAAAVQARLGRSVMSGFHASYSAGALAGAAAGAGCAWAGIPVRTQLVLISAAVLAAGCAATARFGPARLPAARQGPEGKPDRLRWSRALMALSVMAFASFLAEGAVSNWSAVYLRSSLGAPAGVAAAGYTCFAIAMTIGRICGDNLASRWGPQRLVRVSSGLAALAWGAALILNSDPAALTGLVLLGFGLSTVVPNVFSRASRLGQAGPSIAAVTFSGYAGMLSGPAAIGMLAGAASLPAALSAVAGLAATICVLSGVLTPRKVPLLNPQVTASRGCLRGAL